MAGVLTAREYQMLAAVVQEMGEIPAVDFNKIASATGQKYAKNARSAFKKVWEKLKAHKAGEGGQVAGSGDDDSKVEGPKLKSKVTPKKGVGQRKAPVVGSARKTQRKSKKEVEAELKAEAVIKAETEGENDADGELDITGINGNDGDLEGGFGSDDDGHASRADSQGAYKENEDEDDNGAAVLGISVEEFRSVANESLHQTNYGPPTPKGWPDTDDEA